MVAVCVDNDVSASTKSRKPRLQYAEMLTRARAGEFGAILAYSNSRLTRRPREFEDLDDFEEVGPAAWPGAHWSSDRIKVERPSQPEGEAVAS